MPLDGTNEGKSRKRRQSSDSSGSSSSSSSSDFSHDASYSSMPSPPDGGYGWMIVFASFLINFISDGISFSFGILYVELLDYFGESKSLTSWVGSLFYGFCLMGGPLASALATKFGCRKVLMYGGVVATIGTFASAYATDVRMLIVTFGVITGLGMSMGYVTSLVMVAFYFEDKRSLATGISVCGSGIGTFVFAPLTEKLISVYGWRGTMVIWSGIILNLVVCGALLRPLEFTPQERRARALQKFEKMSRSISYASFSNGKTMSRNTSHTEGLEERGELLDDDLEHCHSQIQIPTFLQGHNIPNEVLLQTSRNYALLQESIQNDVNVQESSIKTLEEQKSSSVVLLENGKSSVQLSNGQFASVNKPMGSCLKNSSKDMKSKELHKPQGKSKKLVHMSSYLPMYRKGLFFRGNPARLTDRSVEFRSKSCPELSRNRYDSEGSSSSDEDGWEFIWRHVHLSKHMKRVIKMLIDPSILQQPLYVMFVVSNFILYFWYDVPYIFMADRAKEFGMDDSRASFLISILGIVNTVGQLLYGYLGDREVNLDLLYGVTMMLCGISVTIVPFFTEFIPLAVMSGLFGFFISANYSLCTVILVEYLGLDKLSNAYGLMMLVQGVANLIGPPVAAVLYDYTSSYDLTFYCGGGFIALSGMMLLAVPVLKPCHRRHNVQAEYHAPSALQLVQKAQIEGNMVAGEMEAQMVANSRNTPHATLLVESETVF